MRIYKPTYSKPLPDGAKVFVCKQGKDTGKKFAKFKDPKGSTKMLSDRNADGKTKGHYATPAARKRAMDKANEQHYGKTEGNLGNLKAGDVDVILSSPPYEGSIQTNGDGIDWAKIKEGGTNKTLARAAVGTGYGKTSGQLAEEAGPTFWQAAKEIVQQCHKILKPGGHAIWVCKDFVRKGRRVPFSDDWQKLCEAVGFKTLHRHRAMLVKEESHPGLFGGEITKTTERKSFFRRLAERKGSPPIDYEYVICMIKGQQALFQ